MSERQFTGFLHVDTALWTDREVAAPDGVTALIAGRNSAPIATLQENDVNISGPLLRTATVCDSWLP
ncbi:hypothetical protein BaRGS_00030936 [Batillaria attramentaria]|uniref:Uncharacterized protein n=1 Tax=Batillaria attramentaria TaxID=370345 RepID=A0ABD0JSM4_9CAEN